MSSPAFRVASYVVRTIYTPLETCSLIELCSLLSSTIFTSNQIHVEEFNRVFRSVIPVCVRLYVVNPSGFRSNCARSHAAVSSAFALHRTVLVWDLTSTLQLPRAGADRVLVLAKWASEHRMLVSLWFGDFLGKLRDCLASFC